MIVTFYSFKGGVGRSMALANVAELLATAGYDVVVCDWDLEAPGLERYVGTTAQEIDQLERSPGVIDLVLEYKESLQEPVDDESVADSGKRLPQLPKPSELCVPVPRKSLSGTLQVLTSGRRDAEFERKYAEAIQTFDWTDFYDRWAGGAFLEFFREDLQSISDVVLIDSRTGVTEHGGVCTHHLADLVVLLSATNDLNLEGTRWMADKLSRPELERHRGDRSLHVLPVAARVELSAQSEELTRFRNAFRDTFKGYVPPSLFKLSEAFLKDAEIPYIPLYSFKERVVAREEESVRNEDLYEAYKALASGILTVGIESGLLESKSSSLLTSYVDDPSRQNHLSAKSTRSPVLYLSYASVDREEARQLVQRIEGSELAKEYGLRVWCDLDRDRFDPRFVSELESAISSKSTAFAVYFGRSGTNWVKSEVDIALDRTERDLTYPFIPISGENPPESLPGFAKIFAGLSTNPLDDSDALRKLILAATRTRRARVRIDRPFVGARTFSEPDSHIFLGRKREIAELLDRLRRQRLVVVMGPSGSGKSSIVLAGLVPSFRGGALNDVFGDRAACAWHVISTRPRSDPYRELARAAGDASESIGHDASTAESIRKAILSGGNAPADVARAILESGPRNTHFALMLVIDQFEELFTLAKRDDAQSFIELVTYLTGPTGPTNVCVVATMRSDYYNLCSQYREFYSRVEATDGQSKYFLPDMTKDAMIASIVKPLGLAGHPRDNIQLLVDRILSDANDQPGKLALIQMALFLTWERRREFDDDLLRAYVAVGGVSGALAQFADQLYESLTDEEQTCARRVFLRLARLGETGGSTRRVASRDEFSEDEWSLVEKLATEERKRLVVIEKRETDRTVELSHDAIITQWPKYHNFLREAADSKRMHDGVIVAAKKWKESGNSRVHLLSGGNLTDAISLQKQHDDWLSEMEHKFIIRSRRRRWRQTATTWTATATIVIAVFSVFVARYLARYRSALAMEAADRTFVLVTNTIDKQPHEIERYRDDVAEALTKYNELIQHRVASRRELARLHYRVGRLNELLGATPDLTLQSYETARALQRELADNNANDLELLADLGNTVDAIANVLHLKRETRAAIEMYGQAYAIRSQLVSTASKPTYQRKLANTLMNRAQVFEDLAEPQLASNDATQDGSEEYDRLLASARNDHQKAQEIRNTILDENSSELDVDEALMVRHERAIGNYSLGDLDFRQQQYSSAITKLGDAITEAREVLSANAEDHRIRFIRGLALTLRGEARIKLMQQGSNKDYDKGVAAAKGDYEEARRMLSPLAELYPHVKKYQTAVINTSKNLASVQYHQGQFADALESNRQLVTIYEELIKDDSSDETNRLYLGQTKLNMLYNLHALDRGEELREQSSKLRRELARFSKDFPNDSFGVLIDHLDKILSDWGIEQETKSPPQKP